MVSKKVLGQTVFFAAKPTAGNDFGAEPVTNLTGTATAFALTSSSQMNAPTNMPGQPAPSATSRSGWILALYVLAVAGLLYRLGRLFYR